MDNCILDRIVINRYLPNALAFGPHDRKNMQPSQNYRKVLVVCKRIPSMFAEGRGLTVRGEKNQNREQSRHTSMRGPLRRLEYMEFCNVGSGIQIRSNLILEYILAEHLPWYQDRT